MQLIRRVGTARGLNGQVGRELRHAGENECPCNAISVITVVLLAATVGGGEARAAISGKRAKAFAAEIAAFGLRVAGSSAERLVGDVVADAFGELGYRVRKQAVPLPEGGRSRNIIARSSGPLRVIVVAHLDGVGAGPAANDNGSGVAVMLELARALRGERGLLFAAVGAEERVESGSPIHLGSARLARALAASVKKRVRLAVSLDMVGVGAGSRYEASRIQPTRRRRNSSTRSATPVGRPCTNATRESQITPSSRVPASRPRGCSTASIRPAGIRPAIPQIGSRPGNFEQRVASPCEPYAQLSLIGRARAVDWIPSAAL